MKNLTHEEKIQWMAVWAAERGLRLVLEGECGFGRPCVGVEIDGHYPAYQWDFDRDTYEYKIGKEVWTPPNAYHKAPVVAVLGRGEVAESQLYDWLKWFDDNGYVLETGAVPLEKDQFKAVMQLFMGNHKYARMIKVTDQAVIN